MKKILLLTIVILALFSNYCCYADEIMRFNIPVFPPYTFEENGKIQGIGVDAVAKVLESADIKYSLKIVPNYGRSLLDLKQNNSDGFFLASQNAERDEAAVFSEPVLMNRWCWFFLSDSTLNPKDADFKEKAKAGTALNTNTEKWLKENNYNIAGSPPDTALLLKMMDIGRINAIFLAEDVFYTYIEQTGGKAERYKKVVEVEKPFGIYISKAYLSKNAGIMEKINNAIKKVSTNQQ